jgi:hypothetical protein
MKYNELKNPDIYILIRKTKSGKQIKVYSYKKFKERNGAKNTTPNT